MRENITGALDRFMSVTLFPCVKLVFRDTSKYYILECYYVTALQCLHAGVGCLQLQTCVKFVWHKFQFNVLWI